jgi:hypothetical protein
METNIVWKSSLSIFFRKRYQFPVRNTKWLKRQTSQGYIIRILQHFATKRRNITNFVMLFQAVMKFLSRLV